MHSIDNRIDQARHIALMVHSSHDADLLGSASALYTYVLTLHKKVSLVCEAMVPRRLGFIPWVDEVRSHLPQSADLCIEIGSEAPFDRREGLMVLTVFDFLSARGVKINAKMATALYGGLLDTLRGFRSPQTDVHALRVASELLERGANAALAVRALFETIPLGHLRLKAMLLADMELACDARLALLRADRAMLLRSGTFCDACVEALEEALCLPTAVLAVLLCEREDGRIEVHLHSKLVDAVSLTQKWGGIGDAKRAVFLLPASRLDEAAKQMILHVKEALETQQ